MDKPGKIILIGVVLIAIAVPLAFIIGHNARARMDKFASQGIDVGLGLNTLDAIDKAKEAANLTDQTNQEITQMTEGLTGTSTPMKITYNENSIFFIEYPNTWKIKIEKPEELSFVLPEIILKDALEDKGGVLQDVTSGLEVSISIAPVEYSNLEEYLNSEKSPANDNYFPTYNRVGKLFGKINGIDFYRYTWVHQSSGEVYLAIENKNLIEIRFTIDNNSVLSSDNPPAFNEMSEYSNFQKFLYSFKLK